MCIHFKYYGYHQYHYIVAEVQANTNTIQPERMRRDSERRWVRVAVGEKVE